MKIKNEYVKIKGSKEITLKNYIYDIYLEKIAQAQYTKGINFQMSECFIKFDTPISDITNADYEDFDIMMDIASYNVKGSESQVNVTYKYSTFYLYCWDISTRQIVTDLSQFFGKKITAIGFGGYDNLGLYLYSCLDTSNYSIYFEDGIEFDRKDIITTDTIATEGYPENLNPIIKVDFSNPYIFCYPILYSVGFGHSKGQMETEYIIGDDINVIEESPTSFGFELEKDLGIPLYPTYTLYPGSDLQPMAGYKYIIYKYRYYTYDYNHDEYIDLDDYFTVNLPSNAKGLFEIVTKIERSDG